MSEELCCLWSKNSTCLYCHWSEKVAWVGVYTCASSYLLPVEQLLQLGVQQLWSKKVQEYPYTLHSTPEVAHTSKGQLKHHLNETDQKAPNVMEHVLKPKRPAKQDGVLHSFCSLSHAWQTEAGAVRILVKDCVTSSDRRRLYYWKPGNHEKKRPMLKLVCLNTRL
ncbi:hypothetical protein EMCRGX_G000038 [Ephydatia muelleri]